MIDLRSDTVTLPTQAMRDAMYRAELGDDVYGEDPTVRALEERLADMSGMASGLFLPSGTQSNLAALLAHCGRGDEYIVGQQAHTYKYEGGGAAVLGGIQPQPLEFNAFGGLDLDKVAAAIKPDDAHFARTQLLCLENTVHGQVLPLDYLAEARAFVDQHGLKLHLDGARVFNAAVKQGVPLRTITAHFDTVSICLSKGLGAPAGSVLVGPDDVIGEARRWRKVLGGGMRQAGILAAAGLHALEQHVDRLADDHRRAAGLAKGLSDSGYSVEPVQTNMVFVNLESHDPGELAEFLASRGIRIGAAKRLRLVTHLDIDDAAIDTVLAAFRDFAAQ